MKKLLHERLREAIDEQEDKEYIRIEMDEYHIVYLTPFETEALADAIEKYYIPLPRYEDGEPVQIGDEIRGNTVRAIKVFDDCSWELRGDYGAPFDWGNMERRVNRPAPKVLDADGVEINVGDTVWTKNGDCGKVKSVHQAGENPGSLLPPAEEPFLKYEGGRWNFCSEVTHREPDSLEKLRDDMMDEAVGPNAMFVNSSFVERLTALIERGA